MIATLCCWLLAAPAWYEISFNDKPRASACFNVPSSEFQVPSSKFQVPGFKFQVPGLAFDVCGRRADEGCLPIPGLGYARAGLLAALTPEESVETGREILKRGWGSGTHPWYDKETDGVRPIEVRKPEVQQSSSWNWNWNWTFSLFGSTYTLNVIAMLAILLTVGVLIYVLSKIYAARERAASAVSSDDDGDGASISDLDRMEALPFQVQKTDADLLTRARDLYEQGAFSEAIVYLFSYQLVELDKSHVIRLTKGKTNRQYLREIGRQSGLRSIVERTMVAFEDAFFGSHAIGRQQFEECWSRIGEFQRGVTGAFA